MISGGSQRRAGASGPPNVTLGTIDGGALGILTAGGIITIDPSYLSSLSGYDFSNATSGVLNFDGSNSFDFNAIGCPGALTITGTFTGLSITLINCAQLPTIPTGCISYYLIGTTSTTTLVSSAVLPHNIGTGELTSRLTAVDFSAGSSIETSDVVSWDFDTQALDSSSVNAILAFCVAHGGSGGTLFLQGGTNAAPSGQGILDVATLIGRGWTVTTN